MNEYVELSGMDSVRQFIEDRMQAHALVGYFKYREEIVDIINERPLGAIIAQAVDVEKGWGKSHRWTELEEKGESGFLLTWLRRPKETVEPLVTDLSLPLELYAKSQQATVIESILSGKYDDKTVLVSWSHQHLRDLVKALGVPYKQVPIWDKKRFDITWIVDFDRDGGVHFRQLAQRLLYGDGDTIMDLDVSWNMYHTPCI